MAAHDPATKTSRCRIGSCLTLTLLALGLACLVAPSSLADDPIVEASGGVYGYSWSPANASVAPGGNVTFKNSSASVQHGVSWKGGPGTPSCSGVPVDDAKASWTGTCAFAQAGTYSFYCPVHPTEMQGTITATAGGSPSGGSPPSSEPPATGPVASDLKLARRQRGGTVRGSIKLLEGGAGSRLVVELTVPRARLLGSGHPGKTRVGRLVRSSPPSGHLPFAVSLTGVARGALRDGEVLPLTVTIAVTSRAGEVFKRTRGVVVR